MHGRKLRGGCLPDLGIIWLQNITTPGRGHTNAQVGVTVNGNRHFAWLLGTDIALTETRGLPFIGKNVL